MTHTRRKNGFTFIELLVVITIMAVLTAVAMVSFRNANQSGRNGKRRSEMETVRQALVLYRTDNSAYPDTSSWSTMINAVSNYLSASTIEDPLNDDTYTYTYSTPDNGATFELCWNEEPDATERCIANP